MRLIVAAMVLELSRWRCDRSSFPVMIQVGLVLRYFAAAMRLSAIIMTVAGFESESLNHWFIEGCDFLHALARPT